MLRAVRPSTPGLAVPPGVAFARPPGSAFARLQGVAFARLPRLAFALLLGVALTGCGYRSQLAAPGAAETDGAAAQGRTRIAVVALRNDSPEPWLDRILTEAMRREIDARGGFHFVDDPRSADLVLRGRIRPLDIRSHSFSRFVAALEYGLTLQLDLEVVLTGGDVVRLDPSMLSESDVYLASPDVEVTRRNRLEVLRRLSDLLASRVADSIVLLESPIPDAAPPTRPAREDRG